MSELAQAQSLMQLRRWAEAAALLSRVVASEPGALRPRCLLAQALLGAGNPTEALAQAEAAVALDPTAEWPHRLRSVALGALGHKSAALAAAREAVRLAPNLVNAYTLLTDAELAAGHPGKAGEAAQRALVLAPLDPDVHNALGRVALARRQNKQAEAHFREGLRLDPEDSGLLNNLGLALSRQGKKREAVAYFASSSRANPTDSTAHSNAVRTAAGVGGAGVAVVLTQVVSGAFRGAAKDTGDGGPWWVVALVVGVIVAGAAVAVWYGLRRRGTGHDDPKASRELMRSLRRQRVRSLPLFNLPTWALVGIAALCFVLAMGMLANMIDPEPGDGTSPVVYGVMMVLCLGGAAAPVWAVVRRRRRAEQPYI